MAGDPDKHSVSRRQFLKVAAGGIAGAAVLTSGADGFTSLVAGGPTPQVLLKDLKKSAFAQHLGEDFKIRKGLLETVDFKLIEVSGIAYALTSTEESFSVVFRGPHDLPLKQDTYMVEHKAIGAYPLLIVPVYYDGDGLHYEAVFNRLQT